MRHIREVDKTHVVIAIQVENEVGVLGSTRDFSAPPPMPPLPARSRRS
jgi:hypothetical protein